MTTQPLTKEEAYNKATLEQLGNNPNGTRQDVIYRAMGIFGEEERKDMAKTLTNFILECCDTNELWDEPLTIGEIRDVIKGYAMREAMAFKTFKLGSIDKIYSYIGGDVWEIFQPQKSNQPNETITTEQLYQLYLDSLTK